MDPLDDGAVTALLRVLLKELKPLWLAYQAVPAPAGTTAQRVGSGVNS